MIDQAFSKNFIYTIYLIGASALIGFLLFDRAVGLSIILGGAGILFGMSQLFKENNKLLKKGVVRNRFVRPAYFLRLLIYGILLFVSYYMDTLNIFGTLYGLLTFKIALYAQLLIFKRKGGMNQ